MYWGRDRSKWCGWLVWLHVLVSLGVFFSPWMSPLKAEDPFADSENGREKSGTVKRDLSPPDVIHWTVVDSTAYQNGEILVRVSLATEQNFTLYTDKVHFDSPTPYALSKIKAPPSEKMTDPLTGKTVDVFRGGEFYLLFSGLNTYLNGTFPLSVKYLGCTTRLCLFPYTEKLEARSIVSKETEHSRVFDDEVAGNAVSAPNPPNSEEKPQLSLEEKLVRLFHEGSTSFFVLLAIVFLGGLLTNLTPCVYPMIPITLRLLGSQGKTPLSGPLAYAAGIVVTYTGLGIFAAFTGSMFGQLMANPILNAVLALIMLGLALTMLGFGNLSSVQNLGLKVGGGKASVSNAFLMGAGAGLVAAPCTGPVLAALLAYSSTQKDLVTSSWLLFVYSVGFALPYVFVGAIAARLSEARLSFRWQILAKVLFAACMFGLACYYLRIPAYALLKDLGPYWPTLTRVLIPAGALGLLAVFTVKGWQYSKVALIVPALLWGAGLFSMAQWFTHDASIKSREELVWMHDEAAAFAEAKQRGVPVLIDMWAEWCEACKKMDATTFSDARTVTLLRELQWVLLKFDLTESSQENDKIQEKYRVQGLPTLVIAQPDGAVSSGQEANPLILAGYVGTAALEEQIRTFQK